ncbi:MAG: hypothetical protein KGK18_19135 [Burkholderiales bacterium]|nr:hypothetical protein [Burkholderiales bacterium]
MASTADTLRAIELRAERAIARELHSMMREILGLRTQLVLEDRAHADALLMKLDHLHSQQVAAPVAPAGAHEASAFLMPSLQLDEVVAPPKGYRAFFYCRDYGELEDVVAVESFNAGVQLVRDRLTPNGHYLIEATWAERVGEMTVSTPRGTVLARVEIDDSDTPAAKPDVLRACGALRGGDAIGIEALFTPALEAA